MWQFERLIKLVSIGLLGPLVVFFAGTTLPRLAAAQATASVVLPTDRTVLPIPEPQYPHSAVFDARNATPPPRFEVKAPANAPNVLIVLIDDMGFGQSSAFGGPVHMPTVEKLANEGLRYNEFHTTALCSPTRSALLRGRNHHTNNFGSIAETATAFPGQTGQRPNNVASVAEMLRLNGYSTAHFGKNHETAPWEVSPSGPKYAMQFSRSCTKLNCFNGMKCLL
jgi:Sulfatase